MIAFALQNIVNSEKYKKRSLWEGWLLFCEDLRRLSVALAIKFNDVAIKLTTLNEQKGEMTFVQRSLLMRLGGKI